MAETKKPIEAQCIAFTIKGDRCIQRGIYEDQGDVFCGKHYPYFMARVRAMNQVRREQKAARSAHGQKKAG